MNLDDLQVLTAENLSARHTIIALSFLFYTLDSHIKGGTQIEGV
jgi:hypothetical protein